MKTWHWVVLWHVGTWLWMVYEHWTTEEEKVKEIEKSGEIILVLIALDLIWPILFFWHSSKLVAKKIKGTKT